MRSDEEMMAAAQSNLVIGGVTDALALTRGERTPRVWRAVVVFDAEMPDGTDAGGVMAVTADAQLVSAERVMAILLQGMAALADRMCSEQQAGDEEENDE